jgi:hypothetical protein
MSKVFLGMGHEKEPPQPHGPREGGRTVIHSHSHRPKRHMKGTAMKAKTQKRGRRS